MNPYNVFDRGFVILLGIVLLAAFSVVAMFGYIIDIFTRGVLAP